MFVELYIAVYQFTLFLGDTTNYMGPADIYSLTVIAWTAFSRALLSSP